MSHERRRPGPIENAIVAARQRLDMGRSAYDGYNAHHRAEGPLQPVMNEIGGMGKDFTFTIGRMMDGAQYHGVSFIFRRAARRARARIAASKVSA